MRLCLVLFAIPLAACADNAPGTSALVRDSAGVKIVEHPAGYSAPTWQLGAAPRLDIGAESGDSSTLLYQVEGAHRLSDGRIVVANRSTHELRYYDDTGNYLYSAGRKGQGPGEFEYIAWTASCGADSVFAYDIVNRRLSVFDDHGVFARSFMLVLPSGVGPYGPGTCNSNGTFLLSGRATAPFVAGPSRPARPLALIGSDGTALKSLGEFPGGDRHGYVREGGGGGDTGPRPLGKDLSYVMGHRQFYVGTADTYEIRIYNLDGELRTLIRKDRSDLAITPSDIEGFIADAVEAVSNANRRRALERLYRDMEFPESFPAYSRLILDELGNLWVQNYLRPGESQPVWNVFGPEGMQIAEVSTPPGLHVYEIGANYVLGEWQDELDIEHVRIFALLKPGSERVAF